MAAARALAKAADVDLGLTSGRRASGSDCSKSRHDCGLAFDIGTVNGMLVGSGEQANAEAFGLVVQVQAAAMGIPNIRENFGPGGLFKRFQTGGSIHWTSQQSFSPRQKQLWLEHQNHIHISIQTP